MIFNTLDYFVFFLLPSALSFHLSPPRFRPWTITIFGCAFYLYFSLTAVGGVLGAFCLSIFVWEALVSRLYLPGSWICGLGVAQSLLFLLVFKYWNYFTGLLPLGGEESSFHWAGQFLPLGISFFTFEFIHYAVDRRRARVEPGTLGEYAAFILFFPTMVAGPIKRYQDFLPLLRGARATPLDVRCGVTRILVGLVKKLGVADLLSVMTDHLNAADIPLASRATLACWLVAYSFKIYFDFSGYSDIAIGSARLFGIRIPENFDWPYLTTNITDFWRHWHISLSRWLADYVYVPLGGSRVAEWRVYVNLLATFLVSGLWHGAGTHFVVWGLWHGSLLSIHRIWRSARPSAPPTALGRLAGCAATFVAVTVGWSFFCMDMPTATLFLERLVWS